MTGTPATRVLILATAVAALAACSHSRVVQRDYDPPPRYDAPRNARPASRAVSEPVPRNGAHVVRRGETLYGISFRYGLRYQDVAAWNGIGDPYIIEIGQRLRLRPGDRVVSSPPRYTSRPTTPSSPILRPSATRPGTPVVPPTNPSRPATPPVAMPSVPASGAPAWRWPVRGQIVGRYVAGDQTRQGIDIAGNAGQPVAAAGDGVVVYSGAGLVGYGELIILKHSDEWLSAYAHNRKRLVSEGARVKAGDVIAEMGRTGASRDMLHFEIRRNGKPVDPLSYLPGP
jgi:lipoprotein NlpD